MCILDLFSGFKTHQHLTEPNRKIAEVHNSSRSRLLSGAEEQLHEAGNRIYCQTTSQEAIFGLCTVLP